MAYQKPVCDCGAELVYEADRVLPDIQYKINKNGQIRKKPIRFTDFKASTGSTESERLCCPECGNRYKFDMVLKTGKVLRGATLY